MQMNRWVLTESRNRQLIVQKLELKLFYQVLYLSGASAAGTHACIACRIQCGGLQDVGICIRATEREEEKEKAE